MTRSEQNEASAAVHDALASLRGWNEAIDRARNWGGVNAATVGRLISAILLASGDTRTPVAVSGELNDDATGNAVIVYSDLIVVARVERLGDRDGKSVVTTHALDEITSLSITTDHSHYGGQIGEPISAGLTVAFQLAGADVVLSGAPCERHPLVMENATFAALEVLRERLARR